MNVTTLNPVRFDGRVFTNEGVTYPRGTKVEILGRVGYDYLCRFPGGQETYISTTELRVVS